MIKCGFYIENDGLKSVDCTDLSKGNPGIGGVEYATLLVAEWLSVTKDDISLTLYVRSSQNLPSSIHVSVCCDITEALVKSVNNGDEIFVLRFEPLYLQRHILDNSFLHKLKIILWAHNFYSRRYLSYFDSLPYVKAIVNVGREQLDAYRDHRAFYKSTYIYNGLYVSDELVREFSERANEVTYVGGLYPAKGVQYLTRAWPKVLLEFPDAKLNIIGSGKLYNRDFSLGTFGIAESSFEKQLLEPILNKEGHIIPSVKFWGVLGPEKKEILQNTKVGIPNPGGIGETFGYTAVEMQMEGCLVTTIKNCGYMDTVYDKNMLYTDIRDLSTKIVSLLRHNGNDMHQVREYVKCNFLIDVVGEKWYDLLQDVRRNKPVRRETILVNRYFQLKWLREINRKMKLIVPFLPTVAFYQYYCYRLREKLGSPFSKIRLPIDYDKY